MSTSHFHLLTVCPVFSLLLQIVLTGASFGQAGSVTIGGEQVPTTSLYTDGRIEFNLPPGVGSNLDLVVEASGQFGSAKFSYDPPTVTQIAIDGVVGATGVTEGSVSGARVTLTITGSNFGKCRRCLSPQLDLQNSLH